MGEVGRPGFTGNNILPKIFRLKCLLKFRLLNVITSIIFIVVTLFLAMYVINTPNSSNSVKDDFWHLWNKLRLVDGVEQVSEPSNSEVSTRFHRRATTLKEICHEKELDKKESIWPRVANFYEKDDPKHCVDNTCNIIVDDYSKDLFCYMDKVASTHFKKYFLEKIGSKCSKFGCHNSALNYLKMVSTSFYSRDDPERLSYRKIMFTRHPFRRLVSAFLDKLNPLNNEPSSANFYFSHALPIMQHFRGASLNASAFPRITFEEFLTYLLCLAPTEYNDHWMPYWIRCDPCLIGYDYIGHMETMNQDTDFLFNYRLSTYDRPTNDTITQELFAQVPREKLLKVYEIYKFDFEMFGYTTEGYL